MKSIIQIISTVLVIVLFCQFSMGQSLHPKRIDSHYCFDSLQVRYIAKEIHNSPLKDSLVESQSKEIDNLNDIIIHQDTIISAQKRVIKNDSISKTNFKAVLSNEKELCDILVQQERKKAKKTRLIAILEGVLLFTVLLLK